MWSLRPTSPCFDILGFNCSKRETTSTIELNRQKIMLRAKSTAEIFWGEVFLNSQTPRTKRTSIIPAELAPGREIGASCSLIRANGDFRAGFWCIHLQDRDPARSSLSHRLRWPKMRQWGDFGSRGMLSDTLGSETLISPANPVFNSSLNFQLLFSPLWFNSPNSPCSSMTLLVGKGGFGFNSAAVTQRVPISVSHQQPQPNATISIPWSDSSFPSA